MNIDIDNHFDLIITPCHQAGYKQMRGPNSVWIKPISHKAHINFSPRETKYKHKTTALWEELHFFPLEYMLCIIYSEL